MIAFFLETRIGRDLLISLVFCAIIGLGWWHFSRVYFDQGYAKSQADYAAQRAADAKIAADFLSRARAVQQGAVDQQAQDDAQYQQVQQDILTRGGANAPLSAYLDSVARSMWK